MELKEKNMKIGIITIHRLYNYGTNLQAYALQHYIEEKFGARVEIIDYLFPNKYHKKKESLLKNVRIWLGEMKMDIFQKKWIQKNKFKKFQKDYYHITLKKYKSRESLERTNLNYDLYITGSDQVWNPKTLKNDPIMFCSFAPEGKRRISFGASFSATDYPIEYRDSARALLDKYSYIGVREKTALKVLNTIGVNSKIPQMCNCDPTLLLDKDDYHQLSLKSNLKIKKPFILVYKLGYSYSPEPAMSIAAKEAKKALGIDVLVIGRPLRIEYDGEAKYLEGVGPCDFLWLFEHATYIITSSFHGTMFSLINRKPFVAIIPGKGDDDSRIKDVLQICHLEGNYINSDSKDNTYNYSSSVYTPSVESSINDYISASKSFLDKAINNECINS
jgi:hypothetical protein